jgi:uncharacterized protein (DUF2132 family)
MTEGNVRAVCEVKKSLAHVYLSPRNSMAPVPQKKNPLHGITLKMIVETLVAEMGWEELGQSVPIKCFIEKPSVSSSLTFLRKTPWARAKVEKLYLRTNRQRLKNL